MRNSTMRFAKKLSITFALLALVTCMAVVAFAFVPATNDSVTSLALNEGQLTKLDTGLGLQYGANALRTTTDDFYIGSFLRPDGTTYTPSGNASNGIVMAGTGKISTRVEVVAGSTTNYSNLDANTAVFYGLINDDIDTTFTFSVTLTMKNQTVTSAVEMVLNTYYSADSTESGKIAETESSRQITVPVGTENYVSVQTVAMTVKGNSESVRGSHVFAELEVISGTQQVTLANASISVEAESHQFEIDNATGVSVVISGPNRKTVSISNALSPDGRSALADVYVKEGDVISLRTMLLDINVGADRMQEFGPTYTAGFGKFGSSCIDWYSFYNGEYSRNKSYLTRVDEETHLYKPDMADPLYESKFNAYQGFQASFRVTTGVTNAQTLNIIPRLIKGLNGSSYEYWLPSTDRAEEDILNYQITIKVDNTAPTSPRLNDTKTLGQAIKDKKWYTPSDNFNLDFVDDGTLEKNNTASEQVYAFIVDLAFADMPTDYDFTPGSTKAYTYTAGGKTMTAKRQELGAYTAGEAGKLPIRFDQPGKYGLVLYAIDDAGNVSAPTLYTPNQVGSPSVMVDWRTKSTGIYIKYGDNPELQPSIQNRLEFAKYASVYVLVGSEYHDENGNCTYDISATQPSSAQTSLVNVKRGLDVTVRIYMDSAQAGNYDLVRYALGTYVGADNPEYEVDRMGHRVYSITFKMNDAIWEDNNASERPIRAYFHRRINLTLVQDEPFVYTHNGNQALKIKLDNNIEVGFDNPNDSEVIVVKPKIAIEYFKPVTITVRSEYTLDEVGNVILGGGGSVVIDGVTYDIGSDFDANDFVLGEIPFIVGSGEYYLRKRLFVTDENDGGIKYKVYEMQGFNLNDPSAEGFSDAGEYYFRAYVTADDSTHYYGEEIGVYVIEKADPGVIDAYASNQLTYGESLAELIFQSYDQSNNVISANEVLAFNGQNYQRVSSGVFGTYYIESPTVGSEQYLRHPVAVDYPITVIFRPVDFSYLPNDVIKNNWDIVKGYMDEIYGVHGNVVGYKVKEGAQTAINYKEITLSIPITINHASATVRATDETLNVSYDGLQKEVSATVTTLENGVIVELLDQPLIVEYKALGASDSAYSKVAPEQAGQYVVRITIDSTRSNYSSVPEVREMTIYKRELTIKVDENSLGYSALTEEITAGGATASDLLTYTYSHTQSASYISGYFVGEEFTQVNGLLYRYEFLKYARYDLMGEEVLLDELVWTEPVDVIGANLLDAGKYIMRVEVNNQNNGGEKYVALDVKQVRRGDTANLSIVTPTANFTYDLVDLSGINRGKLGHLEYGQTLAQMREIILGTSGSAKYTPRGATMQVGVSSRFVFESEDEYVNRINLESGIYDALDYNANGERIFPVRYNEQGNIVPYVVKMMWEAGSIVDGAFVPNYNFRSEEFTFNLYVVRAKADFSAYTLGDLTYGQKVSDANFVGQVVSNGYVFAPSDFTLEIPAEMLSTILEGGQNSVLCNFTPSADLMEKYIPISQVPISLFVNKREVNINFVTSTVSPEDYDGQTYTGAVKHVYGKPYAMPVVNISAVGSNMDVRNLVPQYTFYRDYVAGETILADGEVVVEIGGKEYVKMTAITTSTPVGKYYVMAEMADSDKNFFGSSFNSYFVVKGQLYFNGLLPTLSIEFGQNVNEVDFGQVSVMNDEFGNYNKIFNGQIKVAVEVGNELIYDYAPQVHLSTAKNVYIVFVPTGSASVIAEYEANFRPFVEKYNLRVNKKDLSSAVVITNTEHVFNGDIKTITAVVLDPTTSQELPLVITYLTSGNTIGEKLAGAHQVSIVMGAGVGNYTADLVTTMTIAKATLDITDENVSVTYNAKDHVYTPSYQEIVGFVGYEYNFEITYRDFLGNVMSGLPRDVGYYQVSVKLVEDNFQANEVVNFYVEPSYTGFVNANQTYTGKEIVAVTPAFDDITLENGSTIAHPGVNFNVFYKGAFGDFVSALPTDAGEYEVQIHFDHRGYVKDVYTTLVVDKAELIWNPLRTYNAKYTGEAIALDTIFLHGAPVFTLPPEVTNATYEYRLQGETEYSHTAPINAGEYEVRVTLVDNNYKGVRETVLAIAKGDLAVRNMPKIDGNNGTILFNSAREDVKFTYSVGEVYFESNSEVDVLGEWKLLTDVSAYRVGERNVTIEFIPENKNYNSVSGEMVVYISQRDISDLIAIEGAVYDEERDVYVVKRQFIAEAIAVTPTLTTTLPYADNAYFTVLYDTSVTAPTSVKTQVIGGQVEYAPYMVEITLHDANYSGHLANVELVITPALDLEIVLPDFKPISVGEVMTDAFIIENTGGVYVRSNGKAINGYFTVTRDYQVVMDKANLRPVEIQFVPGKDASSVSSPIITAYVNVIGQDLVVSEDDIEITATGNVIYGAPLSSFAISVKASSGLQASVEWANPNEIVRVGASAEYILTPDDTDTYNVKRMFAKVDVSKAEMIATDESVVILYEGEKIGNVKPDLKLVNAYLAELGALTDAQQKVYEVKDYEYTVTTSNPDYVANSADLGKYLEGRTVTITVTHPDYQTFTKEFNVFVKRLITDFTVQNTKKYYDGNAVTIEDLGLSLIGTAYVPGVEDIYFKNIVLNGKSVAEIKDAGVYTVTIAISEDVIGANGTELSGSHAGEFTFTYQVEKYDVSEKIDAYMLNDLGQRVEMTTGTVYAEYVEVTAQVVDKDENGVVIKDYQVARENLKFTYYSKGKTYVYGTLPPTDAGEYEVEVSVVGSPYYVGSATFNYTILKRIATIEVPQAGYTFTYNPTGSVYIAPTISDGVSLDYLQIVYTPQGTSVGTTDTPTNVGIYDVTMNIVNHPNMTGSVRTRLNILKASVTIVSIPSLTSIKYGTPLKGAGIIGGVAEADGGDIISGTFSFANPDKKDVSVGVRDVELIFTPTNVNYATATCLAPITVTKATISVEFSSLEKFYTGSALYPDITLDNSIRVNYSFRKNGLNVPSAIEAGLYEVTVTVVDANYEGSTTAEFNVFKARAIEGESTLPQIEPVIYGSAVKSSAISGGNIVYVSGKSGVIGTFRYLNEDRVLGDVGYYDDVKVIFVPEDSANYETYTFNMQVEVVKATASISVSANSFIYGEALTSPTFTTWPLGLKTKNAEFDENARGKILRTGTYVYTVEIDDKNYKGSLAYAVIVNKKTIDVAFYRENVPVQGYTATFSATYPAKIRVITDTLVDQDIINVESIESHVIYRYQNNDTKEVTIAPPTAIGEYTVTATMDHDDYVISEKSASVYYNVTRATVSAIEFDLNSLSNQIYGSVTLPVVMTTPSNVAYKITFGGYEDRMPTAVGEYSVTVTITDPNYFATERTAMFRIQKKDISLENIKAYSKSYDGLPYIEVTGELIGVMSGDDCDVKLFAHTRDNKVNVGVHSVVIEKWELYGLHANNYNLRDPIYNVYATITNKVITDPNTQSYITSPEGFSSNVTVSFTEVYDTIDNTNFFTQLIGQKATVQVITVKENGLNTVLNSKVKFYVLIPEEYRDAKNLTVQGLGNLESAVITREGDYVTFYADSSGEIIFYKNDFPYWIIIVFAVVGVIVLGTVFALIALPIRRRKRISKDARKAYTYNQGYEGREHAFRKKVEQEIIEKRRRWRY